MRCIATFKIEYHCNKQIKRITRIPCGFVVLSKMNKVFIKGTNCFIYTK